MQFNGRISSADNPQLKQIRALTRHRQASDRLFLLEGLRLVQAATSSGYPLRQLYVTNDFAEQNVVYLKECSAAGTAVWLVDDAPFKSLADTVAPQGIIGLAEQPGVDDKALQDASLLLVLDNIRDPGNLGTILRTAQAAGVGGVLLSPGCVDPFAPKVVRAAMGAHFYVSILKCADWEMLGRLCACLAIVLADAQGDQLVWEVDWTRPSALVVSNEATGPSSEALALATYKARVPMAESAESLNAAVAASIFLYEIYKQRLLASDSA